MSRAPVAAPPTTRGRCRSCQRAIVWTTTAATGRPMPVDPEPVATGNVRLVRDGGRLVAEVVPPARRRAGEELHLPHHATCPAAAQWRRQRARGLVCIDCVAEQQTRHQRGQVAPLRRPVAVIRRTTTSGDEPLCAIHAHQRGWQAPGSTR